MHKLSSVALFLLAATLLPSAGSNSRKAQSNGAADQGSAQIRDAWFTTSDGARIHYREAGQMSGEPPIIFLPGLAITASLWDAQLVKFSSGRLAIAIDSRSQGESSVMLSGNTPERRAIDLHELVASLHIPGFIIVGWSQGAQDVAAYIQRYGTDSLAAVVFVDSSVSHGSEEVDAHKEASKTVLSQLNFFDMDPGKTAELRIRSIFSKPHPDLDMQHLMDEEKKTPPSTKISMLVMDIFGVDRRPALEKIDRPTLVIASSGSPVLEYQKEMAASVPGARFVAVQGAGHALFIDDPETFDAELARLLQSTTPMAH